MVTHEAQRLQEAREQRIPWKRWGPYLSERQWGTVREDYSPYGNAWDYLSHEQARSRAYRWGEDGIAGISDDQQQLCFALALWNGVDPILKERLFGLTNSEGNHGEDVKEYYFYLDNTPTHSYMKYLYKYPQAPYPYTDLVETNRRRSRFEPEYELLDTGVFDRDHYFDLFVEYAKHSPEELLIQITATNRGDMLALLHMLPTLWFRNTWSWTLGAPKPHLEEADVGGAGRAIMAVHATLGERYLYCEGAEALLFTENETNLQRLYNVPNASPYVKDGINNAVVYGDGSAVNPGRAGTKAAAHYPLELGPGVSRSIRLRLSAIPPATLPVWDGADSVVGRDFEHVLQTRRDEADAFYDSITPASATDDARNVMRQALAGMLWSKQYYNYDVERWLAGDAPEEPPPPPEHQHGRNAAWNHMRCADVLSMPDKWEYPWFASWDLAVHTIPLAMVDLDFAKDQLHQMVRALYMHPNGQIPAYEWAFGDVNPPIHAWAAWRVYLMERDQGGTGDKDFLKRIFNKLLLNFTWWVNRKDALGNNVFEGGFLGLDNICVFDRSAPLPTGGTLEQSDGTSWMAYYSLMMMQISLELAADEPAYAEMAVKFLQHFLFIALAMDHIGPQGDALWDEEDGFFYDLLRLPDGRAERLKVRSLVGLLPLCATALVTPRALQQLPGIGQVLELYAQDHPELRSLGIFAQQGRLGTRLLGVLSEEKLRRILARMLDEAEFLGPHGIRAISRYHRDHPYRLWVGGQEWRVDYEPAESSTGLFGGNSNWRGPVWMPMNLLLVEALTKLGFYFGEDFKVEFPTGSGNLLTLDKVGSEIGNRLISTFLRSEGGGADGQSRGRRPVYGGTEKFQRDPHWRDLILFYEYLHGDNGAGIGASHQTGWTGAVAALMQANGNLPGKIDTLIQAQALEPMAAPAGESLPSQAVEGTRRTR
ncbi:MAG: MGH1-like glycoside hydrolase domain-containing protein [Ktedonobacterales bacterium]